MLSVMNLHQNSVLDQNFPAWTLELVLDGSTKRLHEDIKSSYSDRRIKVRYYADNMGLTSRLVNAVADAKTPYIARIDAGDIWHAEKLQKQIEFFRCNPLVIVVGTQVSYFTAPKNIYTESLLALL